MHGSLTVYCRKGGGGGGGAEREKEEEEAIYKYMVFLYKNTDELQLDLTKLQLALHCQC